MKQLAYIILTLFIFISCSSGRVIHFTNSDSNFSSFNSYKFRKTDNDSTSAEGLQIINSVRKSIKSEMKSRGYQLEEISADLQLHYDLVSSYSNSFNNSQNRNSRIFNNNPYPYNNGWSSNDVYKSVLLIELYDIKRKKLVWQASLDMSHAKREKKRELTIARAVERVFSTYEKSANQN